VRGAGRIQIPKIERRKKMKRVVAIAIVLMLVVPAISISNVSGPTVGLSDNGILVKRWSFDMYWYAWGYFGASPAIANLGVNTVGGEPNSDLEIATGSDECWGPGPSFGVWRCFDSGGNLEWQTGTHTDEARSSLAIADMDGDGDLEMAGGTTSGWHVEVLDHLGNFVWAFPKLQTYVGGPFVWPSSPALAEIDAGVSGLELIIGNRNLGNVWAFDGDNSDGIDDGISVTAATDFPGFPYPLGTEGVDWDVLWIFNTYGQVWSSPAVGDVDNDGTLEVVIGSDDNKVYVLDGPSGSLEYAFSTGGGVPASAALANLDSDAYLEMVIGSTDSNVYAFQWDGTTGSTEWTYSTGDAVYSSAAIGDIDLDGGLEIIIGSTDANVYSLNASGSLEWSYATGGAVYSSPALADRGSVAAYDADWPMFRHDVRRTGFYGAAPDTGLDVYVGSDDHYLYLIDGTSGLMIDRFEVYGSYIGGIHTSPSVADVDGDNMFDIFFYDWGQSSIYGGHTFWALEDLGRTLKKELSATEGELGDVIHVTLTVTVPAGETATIVDTLPTEWEYISGSFTVNGVSATPTITKNRPPPPIITEISYTITAPGTHTIEFDCKVNHAYWEDREVCNVATATWYNEAGEVVDVKEDIECFIIYQFEQLHKNVGIPKADVVFAIDLTGSMGDEIAVVKAQATSIMNSLAAQIADVQFGLISYMDYDGTYSTTAPGSTPLTYTAQYGSAASGDYPYMLDQDITSSIPVMTAKINGLTLGWGADGPQDYTRIIHEAYNDSNLHWRTDAKRILILFGDNVPHDTDFDNDNDSTLENTGGDPGRDTILGTADDLDFETEVANAAANGVHVMAVYSGWAGEKYPWIYMANMTSGGYFELSEAEQIPNAIKDLIKKQAEETLTIKEKTEVQWAMVMDVVNPFCYTMKNVTIKDNFGAELEIDQVITLPDVNFDGVINVMDLSIVCISYGSFEGEADYSPEADVTRDALVDMRDSSAVARKLGLTLWRTGKSDKVHLFWYIGDLAPGETARLILLVSTDLNPAGHQEYTEPGVYEMNSGATLKFIDPLQDMQLSAVTDSIYVTVLPLEDP
jgi:hypothetical protein